jgi:rod shape-determining protein MreC
MPQFFLNKRLIILLVSIIILVGLIGFSLNDRNNLSWPEQFLKDTVGWVQSVFHTPTQAVVNFFENVNDVKNTFEENKLLKSRLDEYAMLHENVQELEKENEQLRELLDKKESLRDFSSIQATVIARNPDRWHELVTVNKGEQHGVEKNMAVITSRGMIGKVKYVSQFTSTVQLLSDIDRTNRVSAFVRGNEDVFGLIEGYDTERQALLFKRVPFDVDIKEDQTVITSGLGGSFPIGLVIGVIDEVTPDEYGLTQTAYVKPAANLYDIDHVMIIKRAITTPSAESEQLLEKGGVVD